MWKRIYQHWICGQECKVVLWIISVLVPRWGISSFLLKPAFHKSSSDIQNISAYWYSDSGRHLWLDMQPAKYLRVTSQGSRVMQNKNNFYKKPGRQELIVSKLLIYMFFKLVSRLNPLILPLGGLFWCWLLWLGASGCSGQGYSALCCLGRHRHR